MLYHRNISLYNAEFGSGWVQLKEDGKADRQTRVAPEANSLQWWAVQYKYDMILCFGYQNNDENYSDAIMATKIQV